MTSAEQWSMEGELFNSCLSEINWNNKFLSSFCRLAMTRSIGDLELKPFGVTAVPDVRKVKVGFGFERPKTIALSWFVIFTRNFNPLFTFLFTDKAWKRCIPSINYWWNKLRYVGSRNLWRRPTNWRSSRSRPLLNWCCFTLFFRRQCNCDRRTSWLLG